MNTVLDPEFQADVKIVEHETVVIRFAGDSGDGMQVTGGQFTSTSAVLGNDVHTFPDFPAEIRAPAGTLPGVSGFQLSFSSKDIHTAGDKLHNLIAMNPAALKVNLKDLEDGGLLIINQNSFTEKEFKKAGYEKSPVEAGELDKFRLFELPITDLTLNAVKEFKLTHSQASKCKNMFALGVIYWLYYRPLEPTVNWLNKKFENKLAIRDANIAALRAGYNYALTIGLFTERYVVKKADLKPGKYRQITGNEAVALGAVVLAEVNQKNLLLSGYPITPASGVLQNLAKYQSEKITVFQAEDEIAAMCATVGAAYGGALAMTVTSGPGFDLKSEAIGLAVMTELPCVVINVQRAGPSTGMPTKTEQADLLMAMYGRHGECPVPIVAPKSPSDCFDSIIQAFQIAVKYMTPVIILSDGYIATSAEPWLIPNIERNIEKNKENKWAKLDFAENWIVPGMKDKEFRLGGLEKDSKTGNISYDPENHQNMVNKRADKIKNIQDFIAPQEIIGKEKGEVLVISWGGTYGSVLTAVELLQQQGVDISLAHIKNLNPLPKNLKEMLNNFKKILVVELNKGQLSKLIRAEYLVDAKSVTKITGKPFLVNELCEMILSQIKK